MWIEYRKPMISPTLKFSTAVWIGCCLAALLLGCASHPREAQSNMEQLPLGLFKVIERECAYQPGAPEDCSRTQYLELVVGVFYGIGKDEIALVTWLAENPMQEHGYTAGDLRCGKFESAHEFVVEDDGFGKAWLVVNNGAITDYFFIRHARQTPHGNMAGKTHLILKRTPRSAQINRLLPYPPIEE